MQTAILSGLRLDVGRPGASRVIVDVSGLAIAGGTLTCLSGPSGSGKSSLLYLLSGLLAPSAGSVAWNGVELGAMDEAARDRWRLGNAGFIFQNFHLIDELSPLDNVMTTSWFARRPAADLRQRALSLLDRLGVPSGRRRASLLSRGEQQRVAIARALLLDPPIVFADEPTASLDAASGAVVIETLARLAGEGRTVVAATHDPALLAVAATVLPMRGGRIVAEGERAAA